MDDTLENLVATGAMARIGEEVGRGSTQAEVIASVQGTWPQFSSATIVTGYIRSQFAQESAEQLMDFWGGLRPGEPAVPDLPCGGGGGGYILDVVVGIRGQGPGSPDRWFDRIRVDDLSSEDATRAAVGRLMERLSEQYPYDFSQADFDPSVRAVFRCR